MGLHTLPAQNEEMTVELAFRPLYGVHGGQPLCYLLRVGGFTLLLDCGWTDAFDPQMLEPLRAVVHEVDAGEWEGAGSVGGAPSLPAPPAKALLGRPAGRAGTRQRSGRNPDARVAAANARRRARAH